MGIIDAIRRSTARGYVADAFRSAAGLPTLGSGREERTITRDDYDRHESRRYYSELMSQRLGALDRGRG